MIKNYKQFKKDLLAYKGYISDDVLFKIAKDNGNIPDLKNNLYTLLWNAKDRILKEKSDIEEGKRLKKDFIQYGKVGRRYIAEHKTEKYWITINKIIFNQLEQGQNIK